MLKGKSIPELLGYLLYIIIAVAPVYAMVIFKALGRGIEPLFLLPVILVFFLLLYERGTLKIPLYVIVYGCFVVYTLLSDIYLSNLEFNGEFLRKHLGIGGFLMLVIVENLTLSKNQYKIIIKICLVLIVFAFFVQILQQIISPSFLAKPSSGVDSNTLADSVRLESIYSWGLPVTYFGLSFFPVLSFIVDIKFIEKSKFTYLLLFMGLVAAILNKSRFVLLNYLLILILIPKRIKFNLQTYLKLSLVVGLILTSFLVVAPTIGFDTQKFVNERLLETQSKTLESSAAGTRILAYKVFVQLIKGHELLGKGNLHNIRTKEQNESRDVELVRTLAGRSSQIHVGYLSLFYYYGSVGGGIYIIFLFFLTRKLYFDAKEKNFFGCLLGWCMFLVSNITLVYFDVFNMGLLLLLILNKGLIENVDIFSKNNLV